MIFRRIFDKGERLCSVCYPEHKVGEKWVPVFRKMMSEWNDTEYLENFFYQHQDELLRPYWSGMSIDEAIDQVLDEREDFIDELLSIDTRLPGYENKSLNEVFVKLHDNIYSLNWRNERQRKAKPNFSDPLIRLYGTALEDETLVITGGTIKLTREMKGDRYDREMENLRKVEDYIRREKISDIEGLLNV